MAERLIDLGGGQYVRAEINLVADSTGQYSFDMNSLAQTLTYNGDGNLETVTVGPDRDGNSFRQTLTYTAGKVTGISAWVKQ